jgi:hypothetical protein
MTTQKRRGSLSVLARMDTAGGVHQPACRRKQRHHGVQQLVLQIGQTLQGSGLDPPAGIGMPGEGAEP